VDYAELPELAGHDREGQSMSYNQQLDLCAAMTQMWTAQMTIPYSCPENYAQDYVMWGVDPLTTHLASDPSTMPWTPEAEAVQCDVGAGCRDDTAADRRVARLKAQPSGEPILPAPTKVKRAPDAEIQRTTVMMRNMPNNQTRKMLLELLNREGYAKQADFLYLPMDFKTKASLGYGFVNFLTPDIALRFMSQFEGFNKWAIPSRKVCGVSWSDPHQGLEAHVERYRNSPVMHEDVPDSFRPVLLEDGVRVPFPLPTKRIRPPRLRD